MRFGGSFGILLDLGVLCLLALFPFVTALIVLLVGPLLGDCLLLVVLEIWLLPILEIGVRLFLQLLLGRVFGGSQFWFAKKTNSTQQKTPRTPCRVWCSIQATCVEKIATSGLLWGFFSCSQEEAL